MRGLISLAGLLLCLMFGSASAQTTYKLQPGDTLQLWLAQEPQQTREIVIAPDGWISYPLAGHLKASGLSLQELEAQLQNRLKEYFTDKPNLTVMLRPNPQHQQIIYVTGEVVRPGEYPFRQDMTVLHAISVAGGIYRTLLLAADQDRSILVRRQVEHSQTRLEELKARAARLEAEIRGERTIGTPSALAASPALAQEQSLLDSRMQSLDMQDKAQKQAIDLAESNAASLREQEDTLNKRIDLARRRLQSIANLVAKGGAESSQQSVQEGVVAELEGQGSRMRSEVMVAERAGAAESARYQGVRQDQRTQLLVDLTAVKREQEDVAAQLADSMRIMSVYNENATASQQREQRVIAYRIVRLVDGAAREIAASETTPLIPGDLLRIFYSDAGNDANVSETTSPPPATSRVELSMTQGR